MKKDDYIAKKQQFRAHYGRKNALNIIYLLYKFYI